MAAVGSRVISVVVVVLVLVVTPDDAFVLSTLIFYPICKGRIVITRGDVTMSVLELIQFEPLILFLPRRFMRIPDKPNTSEHPFACVNQRGMQPFLFQFSLMPLFSDPLTVLCVYVCVYLGRQRCVIMSETKTNGLTTNSTRNVNKKCETRCLVVFQRMIGWVVVVARTRARQVSTDTVWNIIATFACTVFTLISDSRDSCGVLNNDGGVHEIAAILGIVPATKWRSNSVRCVFVCVVLFWLGCASSLSSSSSVSSWSVRRTLLLSLV